MKMRPELFYKLASGVSKLRMKFFHHSLLHIHAVEFSPVKEIASKFASADFQNICRLASKKVPKVPFFRLGRDPISLIVGTR